MDTPPPLSKQRASPMTDSRPPVLALPAMLHGFKDEVLRKVRRQGQAWAREYLETGGFTPPAPLLPVPPGELLEVESVTLLDREPTRRWRIALFSDVFVTVHRVLPAGASPRMREDFESFCLGTPWGAIHRTVHPAAPWSAKRMARCFSALSRFWDVLEGARYPRGFDPPWTLDDLIRNLHGRTLEAWCPGGATSVREHLTRTAERMAHATREDCVEALLRVLPGLIAGEKSLEHHEEFRDPDFLRERLTALSPEHFERISGASVSVLEPLFDWDREQRNRIG